MDDTADGPSIMGAVLAAGLAAAALLSLNALNVGSSIVQIVIAIVVGVVGARIVESLLA